MPADCVLETQIYYILNTAQKAEVEKCYIDPTSMYQIESGRTAIKENGII